MIIEKLKNKLTLHPTIKERWDRIEELLDDWEQQNAKMIESINILKKMLELKHSTNNTEEENLHTEK